eukprot:CAMPEP_0184512400 /NCGR_PEP_ID=MMETSP0198_2-20121128/2857_1 /TAXON_ID=1112570 /ORGANISM="Thraustochytrium sp., Strain LLF1b" /LENGTH=54 /DNA_ID=CAMNT_0026902415 /DNA_START=12 /DNA_END=173 /DNA_ORIENTATION=-
MSCATFHEIPKPLPTNQVLYARRMGTTLEWAGIVSGSAMGVPSALKKPVLNLPA